MTIEEKKAFLLELASDEDVLELARKAIEDRLIEYRDSRLSQPMRDNGLVCKEKNGQASSVIRFGPETAVYIALKAIIESLTT